MARHLFAGTTDTAAETNTGARLPNSTGTVWASGEPDADQLTDLIDTNGNPMSMLTADANGMIPAFMGPDGISYLWLDFGAGRYMTLSTDVARLLDEHITGTDPHGDRQYADSLFDRAVPKSGASVTSPAGRDWLSVRVSGEGDGAGHVYQLTDGETSFTRLANDGTMTIDSVGPQTPLSIGAPIPVDAAFIVCRTGRASSSADGAAFVVKGDGSIVTAGTVNARNIGTARVYSGPTPPEHPKIGDVWVQYAE
ncbi:hypothetical protein ACFU99_00760 [Streptomyces sp. NPDC057654]|uniref:hypothetical protein n=1 Tax=Streptomyces sp. NPDC057654 TaxID=3346196 RepID=UPI0036BEF2DC